MAHEITSSNRTFDVQIDENVDFSSLMLSSKVLNGLKKNGFKRPSPVQLKAIPLGKCGVDLIVQAKSGTGKTCVFTVVALEMISTIGGIQAVILAPTREIAVQVKEVIDMIGCCMPGLQCHAFIGGIPMEQDIQKLSNCQIAVGTPGRIKYLIESKKLRTESVRLFVVDEADKLLEPGSFQEQINWIYSTLPSNKQVLALSATYPDYLASHLSKYMNDPLHVRINSEIPTLLGIEQYYDVVPGHHLPHIVFERKADRLASFLAQTSFQQCLVFSNYQTRAEYLAEKLSKKGWPVTFIAGKQSQEVRLTAMKQLKEFHCRILISTDLMSRGIDCDKIDLVINLDLPWDTETYLHRIGRAGRFGNYGMALSFVTPGSEMKKLQGIATEIKHEIKCLPGGECELTIISKTKSLSSVKDDNHTTNGLKEPPNDDLLLVSKENYDNDPSAPSAKPNSTDSLTLTNPIDACSNDSTLEISRDETDFVICHDRTDAKLSADPDALPQGSKQENAKNGIFEPAGNMEAGERIENSKEDLPSADKFESLFNSFVSNELLNSNLHDVEICNLLEEDHQEASRDECTLSVLKRCLSKEDQLNEQVSDKSLVLDRASVMSCRPAESDATVSCHHDDSRTSPVDEPSQRCQCDNYQDEGLSAANHRLPKTGNNNEDENVSQHEPFLKDMPKDFSTTDVSCQSGHRMFNPVKVIDRNIDSSAISKAFGMFINWDLVQSVANQLDEYYEQDNYNEDFAKTLVNSSDKHVKTPLLDQDASLKKQLDDGDAGLCKRIVKSETAPFAEAVLVNQLSDDLKEQDGKNSYLNQQLNNCGLVESDVNSYKPLISEQVIDNQLSDEEDSKEQDRKNWFVEEDHAYLNKQLNNSGLVESDVNSYKPLISKQDIDNQLSGEEDLKEQDRKNWFVEEDHSYLNEQLNNCGLVESDVNSYKPLISKQDIDNQLSGEEDLKEQDRKNLFVEEDHSYLNKQLNNCGLVESDVNSYKPLVSKQDIDNQLSDEEDSTKKTLHKEDVNILAGKDDLGIVDVDAVFKIDDFDFVEDANPNSAKLDCVLYQQTELCPNYESSETNSTTYDVGSSHDEETLTQECLRERNVNVFDEQTNDICRSKLPASLDCQTDRSKWEYLDKSINDVGSNVALFRTVNRNHEHGNDVGETEKLHNNLSKRNFSKKHKQTRFLATNCNLTDVQRGSKDTRCSTRQPKQPLKRPTAEKRDSELCQPRHCSCNCHALSSSKHAKFLQVLHQAYEEQTNWLRFHSCSHVYFRKRDNWLWW